MRIAVVAYEYPPLSSPRALRWGYLARELALQGHSVCVLTPHAEPLSDEADDELCNLDVQRTFAGPVRGTQVVLREVWRRLRRRQALRGPEAGRFTAAAAPFTVWKRVLVRWLDRIVGWPLFPDIRREWNPWAWRRLRRLQHTWAPDVVVCSHEPASAVVLARRAAAAGMRVVVDAGDPILCQYTPRRWRARAFKLESAMMTDVNGVVVTNTQTARLLRRRHPGSRAEMAIITSGHVTAGSVELDGSLNSLFDGNRLEVLYTGRLYSFRRLDMMLEALSSEPQVRLTVITPSAPSYLLEAVAAMPDQVRVFGPWLHAKVLQAQRQCDVLLNVANDQAVQTPGKFFEYLGAGKPVVHVTRNRRDFAADLLRGRGYGDFVVSTTDGLRQLLRHLAALRRRPGELERLGNDIFNPDLTWCAVAERFAVLLEKIAATGRATRAPPRMRS